MDELMRTQIHDALDAAPPPRGLRARVIASVPIERPRKWSPRPGWSMQWAGGFVAGLMAAAIIAGMSLAYTGLQRSSQTAPATPTLISPEGVAVSRDGTVYVSDYVGQRVFRIDGDGKLHVVAGGGVGRDGPATQASMWRPTALTFDVQGQLYVADNFAGVIRRIDHGKITTVATADAPAGLATDSDGVLYEAGYYGDIHAIDLNRKQTETVDLSALPPPAPQFSYMAFDSAGNLYVADRAPATSGPYATPDGGCRVIRLTPAQKHQQLPSSWTVTVVAGTGKCGYSGDGGPATSAMLDNPAGIAFDSNGNLYIADTDNHRIRRVGADGIITTFAGTGIGGYGGDGDLAADAQIGYPAGVAVGPGGLLYFADDTCECMEPSPNGRVRVIRLSDGVITTVAGG